MEQTGPYQLRLEFPAQRASAGDIDQMTREFRSELRKTEVGLVSLAAATGPVTAGAPMLHMDHRG